MKPSEFLHTLWGDDPPGRVQLWRLSDKKALYPLAYEAADYPTDAIDLYTCVALTFPKRAATAAGRPRAEHAVAIAGMWLDIDVPAVPDKDAAITLANTICPPTMIVDSGYGIHAWWLLDHVWRFRSKEEQADAADLSARWYAAHAHEASLRNWRLDQGTRDLARLLRLPGTVNGKNGANRRVFTISHNGPRYTLDELRQAAPPSWTVAESQLAKTGTSPQVSLSAPGGVPKPTLDALLDDPDFAATWGHVGHEHWTTSEWDMSLASQLAAAGGFTDQQIADIVAAHRRAWNPGDPKADRVDYLQRTIARARAERTTPADRLRALIAEDRAA